MSITNGHLGYKLELDKKPAGLTSYAGIPLFIETAMSLGLPALINAVLGHRWGRRKGYTAAELALVIMAGIAAGAKNVDDVAAMKQDLGLRALLELKKWPSAGSLKRFLYWFHELLSWQGGTLGKAIVPQESDPLLGLFRIHRALLQAILERCPIRSLTIDIDASIIESHKDEALPHYDGGRGYQPWIAYCPELRLILRDQFRDGNVPASMGVKNQVRRAVLALPSGDFSIKLRGDTALYSPDALRWMDERNITFGISAKISQELRATADKAEPKSWERLVKLTEFGPVPTDLEIAEVEFVSNGMASNKKSRPFRFIVARRVEGQGNLFGKSKEVYDEQGHRWYLAVVSNNWADCPRDVWNWARERCGTVERAHDELKNDLAAGVMPCGRFHSNAAWFRFNVLTFNLLSAMKLLALPKSMETWRPATIRFRLLNLAGRIISSGRSLTLRLPWVRDLFDIYRSGRERLRRPQPPRHAPVRLRPTAATLRPAPAAA